MWDSSESSQQRGGVLAESCAGFGSFVEVEEGGHYIRGDLVVVLFGKVEVL